MHEHPLFNGSYHEPVWVQTWMTTSANNDAPPLGTPVVCAICVLHRQDQQECAHYDTESWCDTCGHLVARDWGCVSCGDGEALSEHCLECGAVRYNDDGDEWEL